MLIAESFRSEAATRDEFVSKVGDGLRSDDIENLS